MKHSRSKGWVAVCLLLLAAAFAYLQGGRVAAAQRKSEVAEAAASRPAANDPGGVDAPAEGVPPAATASSLKPLHTIPLAAGLPVVVNAGLFIVELQGFDDVKGEFEATSDLRLTWKDSRLAFAAGGIAERYRELRGKEAEAELARIWTPHVDIDNRLDSSGYTGHRLRIFADGTIESIVRTTSRFRVDVDVTRFPFDEQHLVQELVVREQTTDDVILRFDQAEEKFSRASAAVTLTGWTLGDVDLDATDVAGWNGEHYSAVNASLTVTRIPSTGMTTIFIPLIASLLIPLLALWMNRPTSEGFEIPAFELANMGIGGLFSVIALSFAVSSSYPTIAGSDNTVTRLFALNYATLAVSLAIMVLLFRFNLVLRWLGPFVQEQVFRFLLWALPLLTLATSSAFMLVAAF